MKQGFPPATITLIAQPACSTCKRDIMDRSRKYRHYLILNLGEGRERQRWLTPLVTASKDCGQAVSECTPQILTYSIETQILPPAQPLLLQPPNSPTPNEQSAKCCGDSAGMPFLQRRLTMLMLSVVENVQQLPQAPWFRTIVLKMVLRSTLAMLFTEVNFPYFQLQALPESTVTDLNASSIPMGKYLARAYSRVKPTNMGYASILKVAPVWALCSLTILTFS